MFRVPKPPEKIGPESGVLMRIGSKCTNKCPMCTNIKDGSNLDFDLIELDRRLNIIKASGAQKVIITGGEPLLHPEFIPLVDKILELDLKFSILTNGRLLTKVPILEAASKADQVIISHHSDNTHIARLIAGFSENGPNILEEVESGINAIKSKGPEISLSCVLTKINLSSIPLGFSDLRLKITFPSLYSKGKDWPPAYLTFSEASKAIKDLRDKPNIMFQGFPSCIIGDSLTEDCGRRFFGITHYLSDKGGNDIISLQWAESHEFVFGDCCLDCTAIESCRGVRRYYLELFGESELIPF